MAESRSPADVGVEVVAGLIAIASQRQKVVEALRLTVEAAVRELDPDGVRDRSSTWWDDHPWSRPDGFDRFRRAFDDLLVLEVQAKEITDSLVAVLARKPMVVRPNRPPTPVDAHRRLTRIAERRLEDLDRLEAAVRSVRPGLAAGTVKSVRRSIREMRDEEIRACRYRETLGRLLSMGDLVDRAG